MGKTLLAFLVVLFFILAGLNVFNALREIPMPIDLASIHLSGKDAMATYLGFAVTHFGIGIALSMKLFACKKRNK